jgi:Helicase HerA, central domain
MSGTDPSVIGHIVDVQGDLLVATLVDDEQGASPAVNIDGEDVLVGQLGSYVAVRQKDVHLIAIVTRMTEQEALLGSVIETPTGEESRLPFAKRMARLTPIGSIRTDGQFDRGVRRYPTTGAEVHAIGSDDIARMFNRFESKGFDVGGLPWRSETRIFLDPTNLFGRHFAVLGQTGSGKSWTLASLVQKAVAIMPKAHIILIDLHGEYCWKRDSVHHYAFPDAIVRHVDATKMEIPYWLLSYAELCDLLIDETDYSAHNQVAAFKDILNRLRVAEGTRLGLPRTTLDTPVYFDLATLRAEIESMNGQVPGKTPGRLIDGPLTGKFNNFLMRLDSKLNDERYDFLNRPDFIGGSVL